MTLCIETISNESIKCEKTAFLSPFCKDGEISYLFISQTVSLLITPNFETIHLKNTHSCVCSDMSICDFCTAYIEPLDYIVVCTSQEDEDKSAAQLINDIQIFKSNECCGGDDIVYKNDCLEHGRTCNSIHWHYHRTVVSVNRNSPLVSHLPNKNFVACYLPKARFADNHKLNLKTLFLCPDQIIHDITPYCYKEKLGLLPWCKKLPKKPKKDIDRLCCLDWSIGGLVLCLGLFGLLIIFVKHRNTRCCC